MSALINPVRFYPALENGKAIEGVAELEFARLALEVKLMGRREL